MGTTLTGTTPQDTYDSLIKVTDNGPLSGTAKYLSDGLGNDSPLAVSTGAIGIGTTNANRLLVVQQNSTNTYSSVDPSTFNQVQAIRNTTSGTGYNSFLAYASEPNGEWYLGSVNKSNYSDFVFVGRDATYGERMRITSAGNVGIGNTSPDTLVTLGTTSRTENTAAIKIFRGGSTTDYATYGFAGNATINAVGTDLVFKRESTEVARITAAGLCFNGDYLSANALDDYEEGTWTMGITFGGGSTGITYSSNTGTYTKIGRQVTLNGYIALSNKGISTGNASIVGLPFPIPNSTSVYSTPSIWASAVAFANQMIAYGQIGGSQIFLQEMTEAGALTSLTHADFANNSEIMVTFTYFV